MKQSLVNLVFFLVVAHAVQANARIIGGSAIKIRSIPYQVAVLEYGVQMCGGALIASQWVLTANHCFEERSVFRYTVYSGSSDSTVGGVRSYLKEIYPHPSFDYKEARYDFALLELKKPLKFGPSTQPAVLPKTGESVEVGTTLLATGWGLTKNDEEPRNLLRSVELEVVDRNECARLLESELHDEVFCGYKAGGRDTCQADSGGPISANGKVIGIVSWGLGCGAENKPGVYGNVAEVRGWIAEISGVNE
ncbi:trypsin 3A1-like isoform X2 [Uranotaenia lowii]|uniref:trypsin 3A1-like isoform X2 n=1 Tax=Uranotaenia lowii TaxID=190385 RepID=UPI002479E725|nr:trypsin 3A1-like isoform X2 [Uranotaenia lowii]